MRARQVFETGCIMLFGLPLIGYSNLLGAQMIRSWLKFGWAARPFVSIGNDTAIIFFVYGLLYLQTIGMRTTFQSMNRYQKTFYILAHVSIDLCWLGILTTGIGILHR